VTVADDEETRRAERSRAVALFRYALIREAADPGLTTRQRGRLVRELAAREHAGPFGEPVTVSRASLDRWIRAWRSRGFDALAPPPRQVTLRTPAEVLELAAALKRENPGRTAAQVARVLRASSGWSPSERTLQRHFVRLELTTRPDGSPPPVFGRFEAERCNEMQAGDALHGPVICGRKTYLLVTWNHRGVAPRERRDCPVASPQADGDGGVLRGMDAALSGKWPVLGRHERAAEWLGIWADLGRAPRTIDAYARGLAEYLESCERSGCGPLTATRADVAGFVRELRTRPSRSGGNVIALDSGAGLSNATLQQRLVPVRLFYDYLVEEGVRDSNPVGRGAYTPGRRFGGAGPRPLVPRMEKLPWIPGDAEWLQVLDVFRGEPARNRLMLALAYDAALRRAELCSLRTDDLDPAHRTIRVRAETTKTRRERVVPYSAPTGQLLAAYLRHRNTVSRERGPLFLSESRRNRAEPLSLWSWSKIVRRVALEAGVPRFSAHTTRHLCLTDLARMGWEVHAIATFAGHRSTDSTLRYIHLSGRELAEKLNASMTHIHAWRVQVLAAPAAVGAGAP
jgi:site-specific recombinase XerD/transposase